MVKMQQQSRHAAAHAIKSQFATLNTRDLTFRLCPTSNVSSFRKHRHHFCLARPASLDIFLKFSSPPGNIKRELTRRQYDVTDYNFDIYGTERFVS